MGEKYERNPYLDYRNIVPFMDLSGFVVKQPALTENIPATSLSMHLFKKRVSCMINLRRLRYKAMCEAYRNGRK